MNNPFGAELNTLSTAVHSDAADSILLPDWYVWVGIMVLAIDLILLAALIWLLAARGSRVDAEQIQGILVLVAVVAAFEVAGYLAIAIALPPLPRVLVSLGVLLVVIFLASTNWARRSLRISAVAAVLLIGFTLLSIGNDTLAERQQQQATSLVAAATATDGQAAGASSAPASPTVFDAIGAGAETVLEDIPGQPSPPLLLAVVGWAILGVLLLGFWRLVERRSSQQLPGPVTIDLKVANSVRSGAPKRGEDIQDTNATLAKAIVDAADAKAIGTDSEAQLAVFRAALLLNLKEPGAVPGATALQSLSDLVELPGIGATWVTPIVTAVKSVLNAPTGYTVVGEVVPPDTDSGPWVVLLRIMDAASGEQVDVCSLSCDTDVQACRAAGYRAATVILSRSSRIASWANWDSGSADALATYNNADKCDLTDLERAVALAPSSGVLLQLLAARYDLQRQPLDSLLLCARAVTAHPRYPVARYRMTVSLGMLAQSPPELWDTTSNPERQRVIGQLRRACEAMCVDEKTVELLGALIEPHNDPDAAPPNASRIFHQLTQELFVVLRQDTNVSGLIARSFRRSERDTWWIPGVAKFGKTNPRRRSRLLVLSASLIYLDRNPKTAKYLKRVERFGRRPDLDWQISYNLACYYSRRGETDQALTWLEMAIERPRSGQLTGTWLAVDPDLENVRHTERFRWVADQLAKATDNRLAPH